MKPFRKLTHGAGGTINKVHVWDTDTDSTLWVAENYAQLLKTNQKVGPQNVMRTFQSAG